MKYLVTCEELVARKRTPALTITVEVEPRTINGSDVTSMIACEKAERLAAANFGGRWFAKKVVPA